MASETTRFFWGNEPSEEEYYAANGVVNHQSYYASPHGRLFTQSFHPRDPATGEPAANIKALVFMAHGYGSDTGWLFRKIAISYATWGYAVYCADLLGHGRSNGLRCYLGDMEKIAAASLSFFLSVRRDHPSLPAFLFGESMGGAATLLMYLRSDPATWNDLIFTSPLFVIPEDMKPSKLHLVVYGLLFGIANTWAAMPDNKMVGKAIKDPEKLRIIASNPRRYTGKPRIGTMMEFLCLCDYFKENFNKVTVPFFTGHGTDDGVTSPEGSKMLYEMASSDDKTLKIYEGMYHAFIQGETEDNSQWVLGDMREWIDERVKHYGNGTRSLTTPL